VEEWFARNGRADLLAEVLTDSGARRVATSAAKAGTEKKAFIAAVNRCATQNQNRAAMIRCTPKSKTKTDFFSKLLSENR
jgi:hypothetical protein